MNIRDFQAGVCLFLLAVALFIILFRPRDSRAREWAFGVAITILTYILIS